MDATVPLEFSTTADRLKLALGQVNAAVAMMDGGATIPFIARYRRDETDGLGEQQLFEVRDTIAIARQLQARKLLMIRTLEAQGAIPAELRSQIDSADSTARLDEIFIPSRRIATAERDCAPGARELAGKLMTEGVSAELLNSQVAELIDAERQLFTADDVLNVVGDIIADRIAGRHDLRQALGGVIRKTGILVSRCADATLREVSDYSDFIDYECPITRLSSSRLLTIEQGRKSGVLNVTIRPDQRAMLDSAERLFIPDEHPNAEFMRACWKDAANRFLLPDLEQEIRRELVARAERRVATIAAGALRDILLQPPLPARRILAIVNEPSGRINMAVLNVEGDLVAYKVSQVGGSRQKQSWRAVIPELIGKHQIEVVAIGAVSRFGEIQRLVHDLLSGKLKDEAASGRIGYAVVPDVGASRYATSQIGREEFPDVDAGVRAAISIGRQLRDPLAELAKIAPRFSGFGLHDTDNNSEIIESHLEDVFRCCVGHRGVDVNRADASLLQFVSGLNRMAARSLKELRDASGGITCLEQLRGVAGLGDQAFRQSAGFLRVLGGDNPLDGTLIHPEDYCLAQQLMERPDLAAEDLSRLACQLEVGELRLRDIVCQLPCAGGDGGQDGAQRRISNGALQLSDLHVGMPLQGIVLKLVDFGAFVDVGLSQFGLVHLSRIAKRFITSPSDELGAGQLVNVWVEDIDAERGRVSLSMISPDTRTSSSSQKLVPTGSDTSNDQRKRSQSGRAGRQPSGLRKQDTGNRNPPARRRKQRPKRDVKVSQGMIEGAEPMRSFGELKKIIELRDQDSDGDSETDLS